MNTWGQILCHLDLEAACIDKFSENPSKFEKVLCFPLRIYLLHDGPPKDYLLVPPPLRSRGGTLGGWVSMHLTI